MEIEELICHFLGFSSRVLSLLVGRGSGVQHPSTDQEDHRVHCVFLSYDNVFVGAS